MKSSVKWIVVGAVSALLTQGAFAHHHHQCGDSSKSEKGSAMSHQSFQASSLIGQQAKNEQGEDLGKLKDISFSGNGHVFAILDRGAGQYVAVPWRLVTVSPDQKQLTLKTTQKALDAAPTLTQNDFKNLSDPNYQHKINSYFHQQQTGAMGSTGSGSETMKGSDQSKDQPPKDQSPPPPPPPAPNPNENQPNY